jgi:CheY-like chemotaxis protein
MSCIGTILIVEDSDEDFEVCAMALKRDTVPENSIKRCETGDDAIKYLFGTEHRQGAEPPDLILLDLNLPGMNGLEVLARIKSEESTKQVPVVVLSTSSYSGTVEDCYRLGANSYIKKPISLSDYLTALHQAYVYWFDLVSLPRPLK